MKKNILCLLTMFVSTISFAQQASPTPAKPTAPVTVTAPQPAAPAAPSSSIMDIVNQKIKEQNKNQPAQQQNNTGGGDLSKHYNTKGSDYSKTTETDLDEYKNNQNNLKKKIEDIKKMREEALKQQVAYESKLREAALRQAEAQKMNELKSGATSGKKRVTPTDNSDYFEKQRQNAETNSY